MKNSFFNAVCKTRYLALLTVLTLLFTIGSGNVWGDTYTITFNTGSGDGTKASTSTAASTCTTAATYVTGNLVTASNTYYSGGSGLKLGTSSGAGDIKFNLSTDGQVVPTKVSVYAKYYSSKKIKNVQVCTNLGSNTSTTTTGSFAEYSYSYSGSSKLSYIEIKSTGYIWVQKVVVTYTAAAPKYTLKVSDGLGGYTTYSDKVKSDLTESTAMGGNECTGGLAGYYSGWREGSLETPAASPGTTYNHATAGTMPASGSTLYAVYANNSGKYLTNPLCEETKTLSSIAITTQPTTTKYLVGETFSKTGAVVTATYTDATTANVSASTSWTPTTGLVAGSNTITASYTEGGITKTATTTVTAYSVTVQKKDEDGTTIADAGVTASASGRTLTASAGSTHYVFKTWKYGTASGTSIASATSASTSLTGTPSAAVTVIAEFYKPCTVTWSVNGSTYQTTSNVSYNTTTSTPANPSVPGECPGSTFMGWTANSSWASDSAPGDLFNGTSPTITGNITFYAVFADEN